MQIGGHEAGPRPNLGAAFLIGSVTSFAITMAAARHSEESR